MLEAGFATFVGASSLAGDDLIVAALAGEEAGLLSAGTAAGVDLAVSTGVPTLFVSSAVVAVIMVAAGEVGAAGFIGLLTIIIFPSRLIFFSSNPGGHTSLSTGVLVTVTLAALFSSIDGVAVAVTATTEILCRAESDALQINPES